MVAWKKWPIKSTLFDIVRESVANKWSFPIAKCAQWQENQGSEGFIGIHNWNSLSHAETALSRPRYIATWNIHHCKLQGSRVLVCTGWANTPKTDWTLQAVWHRVCFYRWHVGQPGSSQLPRCARSSAESGRLEHVVWFSRSCCSGKYGPGEQKSAGTRWRDPVMLPKLGFNLQQCTSLLQVFRLGVTEDTSFSTPNSQLMSPARRRAWIADRAFTALFIAVHRGHQSLVNKLLDAGNTRKLHKIQRLVNRSRVWRRWGCDRGWGEKLWSLCHSVKGSWIGSVQGRLWIYFSH